VSHVNWFGRSVVIFLGILFLSACVKKPVLPPEYKFEAQAIKVHVKADSLLNLQDGMPHTLLICVYQLREPNAFNQNSDMEKGLRKLVECEIFAGSVVHAKRLIVHPGTEATFNLDRAEGAKYVGIVAGYYLLEKERMTRLFDIPLIIEEEGWIFRTAREVPELLEIILVLGPKQIHKVEELNNREDED
jgi:type VI secretion system VasD/TssJ family lipoprotein